MHKNNKLRMSDLESISKLYFYEKLSTVQIGEIYNVNHNTIYRFMLKNGLTPRKVNEYITKYKVNMDYFKSIDSSDKAYFLGLIYADGFMDETNNCVRISLASNDGYILELFKKYTNYTGPISFRKSEKDHFSDQLTIQIYNKVFFNNAYSKGLYQNKSLTLKFPTTTQLPKSLYNHFIRGYFDGDGCICNYTVNNFPRKKITIVGTLEFLSEVQNILIETLQINRTKLSKKSENNTYCLNINKKDDILLVQKYLYDCKTDCFLSRKYNKF